MSEHDTTITITDVEDAKALLAALAAEHDWVSVLWDRGWGDSPLEISIITDGDGQHPHAHITAGVYRALVRGGTVGPNDLQTYKARRNHSYELRPTMSTEDIR